MKRPSLPAAGRFGVVCIGGTFEGFHDGHRDYVRLALSLGGAIHVFVSDANYAQGRKTYDVTTTEDRTGAIRELVSELGRLDDCTFHVVRDARQLDEFCLSERLDLAIVIPQHLARFQAVNERRKSRGLPEFYLLVKPRTAVDGVDVSASALSREAASRTS